MEPYGEVRMDHRFALMAFQIVTGLGVRKEDKTPFTVSDFLLTFPEAEFDDDDDDDVVDAPDNTVAGIERAFRMWAAAANAKYANEELKKQAREQRRLKREEQKAQREAFKHRALRQH